MSPSPSERESELDDEEHKASEYDSPHFPMMGKLMMMRTKLRMIPHLTVAWRLQSEPTSRQKTKNGCGADVTDNVAKLVTSLLTEQLLKEKMDALLDPILRLANVPMLQVQQINSQLWTKLANAVRG